MNLLGEKKNSSRLAASYTHNTGEKWEQQETQHGCHDGRLGAGREEEGGKTGGSGVKRSVLIWHLNVPPLIKVSSY